VPHFVDKLFCLLGSSSEKKDLFDISDGANGLDLCSALRSGAKDSQRRGVPASE
jgi:hypothetical protein